MRPLVKKFGEAEIEEALREAFILGRYRIAPVDERITVAEIESQRLGQKFWLVWGFDSRGVQRYLDNLERFFGNDSNARRMLAGRSAGNGLSAIEIIERMEGTVWDEILYVTKPDGMTACVGIFIGSNARIEMTENTARLVSGIAETIFRDSSAFR